VLGKYLLETLKDELKFCCLNCRFFDRCLDMENLSVGELFLRRVNVKRLLKSDRIFPARQKSPPEHPACRN